MQHLLCSSEFSL